MVEEIGFNAIMEGLSTVSIILENYGEQKMNSICDRKLLETVAFSNGCICFMELIQWEHTHFHPSGQLLPSKADTMMTDRMNNICELLGIPLVDHLIVGGDNKEVFSFKEKGLIKNPHIVLTTDYRTLSLGTGMVAERCRTDFADIQNKKECGGNRQWQNHYLRKWAADMKGRAIIQSHA